MTRPHLRLHSSRAQTAPLNLSVAELQLLVAGLVLLYDRVHPEFSGDGAATAPSPKANAVMRLYERLKIAEAQL